MVVVDEQAGAVVVAELPGGRFIDELSEAAVVIELVGGHGRQWAGKWACLPMSWREPPSSMSRRRLLLSMRLAGVVDSSLTPPWLGQSVGNHEGRSMRSGDGGGRGGGGKKLVT